MVITATTDRDRGKPRASGPSVTHTWEDFVRVYPIYSALAQQCDLTSGPYPPGTDATSWANKETRERDLLWLDAVDGQVQAVDIRQLLATPTATREGGLRIFLLRHLHKPRKLDSDRDKIDLLIVQYFVLCAPQNLIAGNVQFEDVAGILQPLFGDVEAVSFPGSDSLEQTLASAGECRRLRDFMERGLMDQGRMAKEAAGAKFYQPSTLVAICRFNFILRRTFIQLLHGDLRAIGEALNALDRRGIKSLDCRNAGLSESESVAKLKEFHQHWKAPFQSDYSQASTYRIYEQLMSLREDLEEALGGNATHLGENLPLITTANAVKSKTAPQQAGKTQVPAKNASPAISNRQQPPSEIAAMPTQPQAQRASNQASKETSPAPEQKSAGPGVVDIESLEEKIWEQLIASPPARGRSMTTVTVEDVRVLLSAWEVAAFVSASGQNSDDLRRVIVARALLSTAIERRKRFLDFRLLHQAVTHAKAEIPRLHERIDQLKRTMKTDSAVNLGISLKRLLSMVEEAEQLQKGNPSKETQ
jgi:hypothetical protein